MIERLVLLLLVGGCLLFGAIILIELAPAGAEDTVVTQATPRSEAASPITRPQNARPEELVGTALARPLFSSTRRPPQEASSGAAGDSDLSYSRLTGFVTIVGHNLAIFASRGAKPLRVAEVGSESGGRTERL